MDTETVRATEIAKRNDEYRRSRQGFVITRGVSALPDISTLLDAIRDHSKFNEDNDPYGEHDFGSLRFFGQKLFWKIDYYDSALEAWCDPLSEECHRVLTVMLAEEY